MPDNCTKAIANVGVRRLGWIRPKLAGSVPARPIVYITREAELAGVPASLGSAEKHLLLQKASNAEYVSPGYVVFAPGGDLTAQVLDMTRMQLTGEALFPSRITRCS